MPRQKTEVLYDTDKAIGELKKLDKQVDRSSKKAKKGFDASGQGAKAFESAITKISPRAGKLADILTKVGVASSGLAAGFAAAGLAVGATVANVFNFAEAMRSADATLGDFLANARRAQAFADAVSATADARRLFKFEETKDEIARKRLFLTQSQIETDARRDTARAELEIEKDKLRQLESLQKAARQKRLSAEKRLQDKLQERTVAEAVGQFSGQPTGRQVTSLAAKARTEAQKGNVEVAEALIEKAKELSAELGNHAFFTNKIKAAEGDVTKALERQVKDAKTEETALGQQLAQQKSIVQDVQARAKEEEQVSKRLRDQLKLLSAQQAVLQRQRKAERRLQDVQQGERDVGTGIAGLRGEFGARAAEGTFRQFINAAKDTFTALRSLTTLKTVGPGAEAAGAIEARLLNAIEAAAPGGFTPGEIKQLGVVGEQTRKGIDALRTEIKAGTLNPAIERFLNRTEAILNSVQQIVDAGARLGPVAPTEAVGAASRRLQTEADVAQEEAQRVGAQIEINANIQGGTFDEDAIQDFLDVLRREVRKEVARQSD